MKALVWLVFIAGLIICVIGFSLFGASTLPPYPYFTDWVVLAGVVLMGMVPLAATLALMRSRRAVQFIYLGGAAVEAACALWIWLSKIDWLSSHAMWAASLLFILLGIFYRLAHHYNWPSVLLPARPSWKRKVGGACAGCAMILLIAIGAFRLGISDGLNGDCGGASPFARPISSDQAVFVARFVVLKGWPAKLVNLEQLPFGIVQQHFWGLPFWDRKIVVIGLPLPAGKNYFIDGRRMHGFLTQFLPVVEFKPCNRTQLVENAEVDLRLVKDGPPHTGVRIIGHVFRYPRRNSGYRASGISVSVSGPAGTKIVTTDQNGIYDLSGVPPGQYSISAGTSATSRNRCNTSPDQDLKDGDVWGCDLGID